MTIQRSTWACRTAVAAILLAGAPPLRAQSPASDAHALNQIFGDRYLSGNVLAICSRAAELAPDDRCEYLADWVLPGEQHPTFRVVADFSPTYPAPTSKEPRPPGSGFRVPAGGEIVSPARDLIDTAASLGRLEDLRRIIEATATSVEDRIDQLALLALVDVARDDVPSAQTNLTGLFTLVVPEEGTQPRQLDPVLLCVDAAADHPRLSLAIVDAAYRVVQSYQQVYERSAWQRQFSAAYARVRQAADAVDFDAAVDRTKFGLARWTPASPPRARYRGTGCPIAQWVTAAGRADNLVSHDQDFLYFAVPLRGDYEVECDVTGFGWRDSSLLVAGRWIAPVYDHKSYDRAGIDGFISRVQFAPPLTEVGDYIHYRTVVRDGTATTYFNGRAIDRRALSADCDPWLAVRSVARHDGGVCNLRITGEPVVPETLRLASSADLKAWVPYYEEIVGIDWQYRDATGELHASRDRQVHRGSAQESALFYHRSLLEDGSIEYEFWYEPDVCEAHPVLDRLSFILDPAGVHVHWLTDGPYERTDLAPDNLQVEPDSRRGSGTLPLREGDWNHLRLSVRGDTVDLVLNGEVVYRRNIDATNRRHFGLLHYADQTELRVRNVIWKGDWPREIPSLHEQELFADETGFLDERLPELTAVFSHDFAEHGLPPDRFAVIHGDAGVHINPEADGLHVARQAEAGYLNATVAPRLAVSGDFDITASFDHFRTNPRGVGSSNIFLQTQADNATADEALVGRRQALDLDTDRQIMQCVRVVRSDGQARRSFFAHEPVEAFAGTLRLARRGERIYYLFAENDSRQFRLFAEDSHPADQLRMQGVRLITQIHGDEGSTSVVWKDLTVRAESLAGPAVDSDDSRLAELNRERTALAQSCTLDFTSTAPDEAQIYRWTDLRQWDPDDDGLLIVAPGTADWTSAGASLLRQIEGDFDVAIRVDPRRLDTPADGQNSAVYFQVELADDIATQLSLVFRKTPPNETSVVAQISVANDESVRSYRTAGRLGLTSAQGLRIARRGEQIIWIVLSEELGGERIVTQVNIGDAPIASSGTRLLVHTGGTGRESHVVWKSLAVHAERILE